MLREIPEALAAELRALEWRGRRGLEATEAAAAVILAVLVALGVHSSEPWWAAITAFMVTRASPVEAISRGILRVTGSIVGAVAALVVLRLFVYQSLPFLLCLFLIPCIGLFGFVTSRHSYAWLVGSVTACLVMLMSFGQPQQAFATAVNRVIDVIIGTAALLVVCALSPAPVGSAAVPAPDLLDQPPLALWRRGYGSELQRWLPGNVPLLVNACRGGLTVMLMPALAEWIWPVSPVTMGVTAVMVMSIPTTGHRPFRYQRHCPARSPSSYWLPARGLDRARLSRICWGRFLVVDRADPTRHLAMLADPERDDWHQLYRHTGHVRISDEHAAGPRSPADDQPGLRAPGWRHGRSVDLVRRHLGFLVAAVVTTRIRLGLRRLTRRGRTIERVG